MAAEEKRFTFTGVDNGVSSLMDKLRSGSRMMAQEVIKDANKYGNNIKEQTDYIQRQIKELEKRNKLETDAAKMLLDQRRASGAISDQRYKKELGNLNQNNQEGKMTVTLLKEVIETIKQTAKDEIKDNRQQVIDNIRRFKSGELEAQSEEEWLKLELQQKQLEDEEAKEKKTKPSTTASVFTGVLLANMLRDAGKLIMQAPNANTGLDLLNPALRLGGMATGGLAGSGLDMLLGTKVLGTGVGQTQLGALGAQVGESVAGFIGSALERSLRLKEAYSVEAMGVRAITGNKAGGPELSRYGLSLIQSAQVAQTVALAMGTSQSLFQRTTDFVAMQKGFKLDQGLLSSVYGQRRIGVEGSPIDRVAKALELAIREGIFKKGDTTLMSELLTNQNALLQTFSESAEKVSGNSTLQMLMEFNRVGGSFKLGDPRSMSRIAGINNDLANASSPFTQATNYMLLRGMNPNAGIFDLQKQQQQGLQTPGFLKAVIEDITGMGGSEDFQKLMLASRLPSLNLDSIDTLFKNRGAIGSMNEDDIAGLVGDSGAIRARGSMNVGRLTKAQASVENAFIDSFAIGIKEVKNQFINEMGLASKEIARVFKEEFDKLTASTSSATRDVIEETQGWGPRGFRKTWGMADPQGKKPNIRGGRN